MSKVAKTLLGPLAGGTFYDSPLAKFMSIKDPAKKRRMRKEEEAKKQGGGMTAGAEPTMRKGGKVKKMARGGKVTRGDGICKKGHTKGKMR